MRHDNTRVSAAPSHLDQQVLGARAVRHTQQRVLNLEHAREGLAAMQAMQAMQAGG